MAAANNNKNKDTIKDEIRSLQSELNSALGQNSALRSGSIMSLSDQLNKLIIKWYKSDDNTNK